MTRKRKAARSCNVDSSNCPALKRLGVRRLFFWSAEAWGNGNTHGHTGREVNPLPYGRTAKVKNAGRLPALLVPASIFAWLILFLHEFRDA